MSSVYRIKGNNHIINMDFVETEWIDEWMNGRLHYTSSGTSMMEVRGSGTLIAGGLGEIGSG